MPPEGKMTKKYILLALLFAGPVASVDAGDLQGESNETQRMHDRKIKAPPTRQQILHRLFSLQDVKLKDLDKSCHGIGANPKDVSIGDYISGVLAQLNERNNANWIEASCESAAQSGKDKEEWDCKVMFKTVDADSKDPWSAGLSFHINKQDDSISKSSISCPGQ
jgi:hypothetical protein